MARGRMVPTHFFKDLDIMNLSKETQLILIGLILVADDEGREAAHAGLLGREIDVPAESIEAALCDLVANDLLLLYQAGRHRYFQLTRWKQWQTLGGHITPSRHPAPPEVLPDPAVPPAHAPETTDTSLVGEHSGRSRGEVGENPETSPTSPRPREEKRRESSLIEDEEKPSTPHSPAEERKVLVFPTRLDGDGDQSSSRGHVSTETHALGEQVARILHLPVTDALMRLVTDYASLPGLSILGEADAAWEYIADPGRNKRHKRLDVGFFRDWLEREKERLDRAQVRLSQEAASPATGTTGGSPSGSLPSRRPPSLTGLAQQDQAAKGTKHA